MISRIYTMTHKSFTPPPDKLYVPLLCGAARGNKADPGILKDDTGDNISLKNPFYSELTGLYWVWKNDTDCDVLGLSHYRRFLLADNGKIYDRENLEKDIKDYELLTTRQIVLDYPYETAFGGKHNPRDFEILREAVRRKAGDYIDIFESTASGNKTYFANMIIAGRDIWSSYCEWLFDILFEMEKYVDMNGYNDYQKRLYGFVSELLLMVWIKKNRIKVKECSVAVIGGKKETEECIAGIGDFFKHGDVEGASGYFMDLYAKRPDILMEASDVNGDMKLIVQMLAVFKAEIEETGHCYLEKESDMGRLLDNFRCLNKGEETIPGMSETARRIADMLKAGKGQRS